jgi:hypothetical protein
VIGQLDSPVLLAALVFAHKTLYSMMDRGMEQTCLSNIVIF